MTPTVRRNVHFTGQVQGVGFRYTACEIAARFQVTGFVRNLADGRVELVAEGEPDEINLLVEAVSRRMKPNIRDVATRDLPATGEFSDFRIAF